MARWTTKTIVLEGGTKSSVEPIAQESVFPGSLIASQNVEAGEEGGYARIKGFEKYDSAEVPGSGAMLGTFVFNNGVVACRGTAVYFGTGSGWGSNIAPSTRTAASYYQAAKYTWGATERITIVDGVNKPMKYDGSTATDLTAAQAKATCAIDFKNHLFIGVGGTLYWSAPNDDTTWSSGAGGGSIVIGDTINALGIWREALYVFCTGSVHRLTGNSATDFAEAPVTERLGCEHGHTVKEVAGDLFFLSNDGIRTISGTEQSGDISLDSVSKTLKKKVKSLNTDYASGIISSILVPSKGQYRLFGSDTALTTQPTVDGINFCITENLQEQTKIVLFPIYGINVSTGDSDFANGLELVVHGSEESGYVYKQEDGGSYTRAGSTYTITGFYRSPDMSLGDPGIRKTMQRVLVNYKVREAIDATSSFQTFSLKYNFDDTKTPQPSPYSFSSAQVAAFYGSGAYGTSAYGSTGFPMERVSVEGSGFVVAFKLEDTSTKKALSLRGFELEHINGGRR